MEEKNDRDTQDEEPVNFLYLKLDKMNALARRKDLK